MNNEGLYTAPGIGGTVIVDGQVVACFSGNSGPTRAEAFYEAMTKGRTARMKKLARESGISYRHIDRALEIGRENRSN